MFLLSTVTLCCGAVAGTIALFDLTLGSAPAKQTAERAAIDVTAPAPVRVVGARFEPNVNPRER